MKLRRKPRETDERITKADLERAILSGRANAGEAARTCEEIGVPYNTLVDVAGSVATRMLADHTDLGERRRQQLWHTARTVFVYAFLLALEADRGDA